MLENFERQFNQSKPENLQEKENEDLNLKEIRRKTEDSRDRLGLSIDEGIKETVVMLNAHGLSTSGSCEGHVERGLMSPYVDVSAPNEPDERYIGQNQIFEKIAQKYNITFKEVKYAENYEAYWEAIKECSKNEETEQYKRWNKENEKLLEKANELLKSFYENRKVMIEIKLRIRKFPGDFRIYNGNIEDDSIIENKQKFTEEEKKICEEKLKKYRKEMDEFTEFLKQKYFENLKKR